VAVGFMSEVVERQHGALQALMESSHPLSRVSRVGWPFVISRKRTEAGEP
jgi:hypothetical protein